MEGAGVDYIKYSASPNLGGGGVEKGRLLYGGGVLRWLK
jgi:hypothetical protein